MKTVDVSGILIDKTWRIGGQIHLIFERYCLAPNCLTNVRQGMKFLGLVMCRTYSTSAGKANIALETSVAWNCKSAFEAINCSYLSSVNSGESGLFFSHQYSFTLNFLWLLWVLGSKMNLGSIANASDDNTWFSSLLWRSEAVYFAVWMWSGIVWVLFLL